MIIAELTNKYGNIDVSRGVPDGFVHLGNIYNLQGVCRRHNIDYATALISWSGGSPRCKGVVVDTHNVERLLEFAKERKQRQPTTDQMLATARKDVEEAEKVLAEATRPRSIERWERILADARKTLLLQRKRR